MAQVIWKTESAVFLFVTNVLIVLSVFKILSWWVTVAAIALRIFEALTFFIEEEGEDNFEPKVIDISVHNVFYAIVSAITCCIVMTSHNPSVMHYATLAMLIPICGGTIIRTIELDPIKLIVITIITLLTIGALIATRIITSGAVMPLDWLYNIQANCYIHFNVCAFFLLTSWVRVTANKKGNQTTGTLLLEWLIYNLLKATILRPNFNNPNN